MTICKKVQANGLLRDKKQTRGSMCEMRQNIMIWKRKTKTKTPSMTANSALGISLIQ